MNKMEKASNINGFGTFGQQIFLLLTPQNIYSQGDC